MITLAVAGVAYLAFGHILIPLYTRRPDMTDTTPSLTPVADSLQDAVDKLNQLLATRLICTACAFTAHKAGTLGATPLNLANVIADGNGLCFGHVQFAAAASVPVQTAGGIILPGAGA